MSTNTVGLQPRIITTVITNPRPDPRGAEEYRLIRERPGQIDGIQGKLSNKLEKLILQSTEPFDKVPIGPINPTFNVLNKTVGPALYKQELKKLLKKFKKEHIDLNQPGKTGLTPLQLAGACNNTIAAKELKKAGAQLNYIS